MSRQNNNGGQSNAEVDELFEVKTYFYIGAYQQCLNEINKLRPIHRFRPTVVGNSDTKEKMRIKKFKFTIIGDGFIYWMLSDMQPTKGCSALCNHSQTLDIAHQMLIGQKEKLKHKNKRVIISIGTTDIKNGQRFVDIKRDFTKLFITCHENNLKPLITTILCFDNPHLKYKADMFNQFLRESFQNVIDLQEIMRFGLAEAMTLLDNRYAKEQRKRSLELGRLQQLVLNVKE